MLHDGQKIKGRFFKHNSRMMKVIKLEEFDFHQLKADFTLYPDNANGSIVHSRLHNADVIKKNTQLPSNLFPSLQDEHAPPNMKPRDFTDDWKDARRKAQRKKGLNQEEEEDFDNELEEHFARLEQKGPETRNVKAIDDQEEGAGEINIEAQSDPSLEVEEDLDDADGDVAPTNPLMIRSDEDDPGVGREPVESPLEDLQQNAEPLQFDAPPEVEPVEAPSVEDDEPKYEQQEVEKIMQDAFEKGFQQGAEEASKGNADIEDVVGKMKSSLEELSDLKNKTLNNIQNNFQELTAAICEGVLGHTLSEDPFLFAKVIQNAVDKGVKDDQFKVQVGPQMYDKLKDVVDEKLLSHLELNEEIEGENFKVVADWGEVDGAISKLIRNLLSDADTRLFDKGSDDAHPYV